MNGTPPTDTGAGTRILIVRVGAMGDVLHAMPAVAALRAHLPSAYIGWAVEPRWASLLQADEQAQPMQRSEAMPIIDRLHAVPTRAWSKAPLSAATARSVLALRRDLHAERYDIAVDLQGSIRSAVIARMSGARHVVGPDAPRERAARLLYGQRVVTTSAHVIDQAAEMVSAALHTQVHAAPVLLPVDPAAEAWCDALLRGDPRRVVFMAASAGWGAKQWPSARFGELARALAADGLRVLVNAAGESDPLAHDALRSAEGGAEAVVCSLPQLTALLRRTSLAIAGDTGPMHLAAALGRPVVALFGPTDPARTGPYAVPSRVLRSPRSITSHRRLAVCEPGLLTIETGEVLEAARDLLRGSS